MPSKLTQEEFIAEAFITHGDKYDYSRTLYNTAKKQITITCSIHGDFSQLPFNHLKGSGCPACGVDVKKGARFDTQEFILRAKERHGEKYDYSKAVYAGFSAEVEIVCIGHGSFTQRANNHLAGVGCPACGRERVGVVLRKSEKEFITEASNLHQNKYDYGKAKYSRAFAAVEIICPAHGVFWQTPDNHLNAGAGCPSCSHHYSNPHKEIEEYLQKIDVTDYISNDRTTIPPFELDTWLPAYSLAIEFNGRFWHSLDSPKPASVKNRHRDKFIKCRDKGIALLQIDEHEWSDPVSKEVWKSVISSKLGLHRRVHARATSFQKITKEEAEAFLARNHIQGATPNANYNWCFGLCLSGELHGVMTFSMHEKRCLNLTRMAFPLNTTVVGGAQKLFKNALAHLPKLDIVTFSNNRYSLGKVYSTLGFCREESLPPSYQWYFRGRIWNKRLLRRKHLPNLLQESFDPAQTVHENLYRNGARCLYDAGYERWLYQ